MGKLVRFQYSAATVSPPLGWNKSEYQLLPKSRAGYTFVRIRYTKVCKFCSSFSAEFFYFMITKRKTKIIFVVSAVLVVISTSWLLLKHTDFTTAPPQNNTEEVTDQALVETQTISKQKETIVNKEIVKSGTLTTLEIEGVKHQTKISEATTVYNFMDQIRKEGKVNFKEKTYTGLGKFIEEINGIRGNGDKYWIYYVNGKKAWIGVSNYKIGPGDVVSWKYEKDIN